MVAVVSIDSELMLHQLPAGQFSSSHKFAAVLDENLQPLIFAINSDKILYALKRNNSGSYTKVNLSESLHLDDPVEAFSVTQSLGPARHLFIAVATYSEFSGTKLSVIRPLLPQDISSTNLLREKYDTGESLDTMKIHRLFSTVSTSDQWPLLLATFSSTKGIKQVTEDIQVASIRISGRDWNLDKSVGIPQVAKEVLDIVAVNTVWGKGAVYLYKDAKLRFGACLTVIEPAKDEKQRGIRVELKFPEGATPTSMASITCDPRTAYNGVLCVGGGLFAFDQYELLDSGTVARQLSDHSSYKFATALTVAESSGAGVYASWFQTGDRLLAYQRGSNTLSEGSLFGSPTPFLPADGGLAKLKTSQYAPVLHPALSSQTLLILDEHNNLSALEQIMGARADASEGAWQQVPLLAQDNNSIKEVNAYMVHVEISDEHGLPAVTAKYGLKASRRTTLLINGSEYTLSDNNTATIVETNERGILTLVIPTEDIACPTFSLFDCESSFTSTDLLQPPKLARTIIVDPSAKALDNLATLFDGSKDIRKLTDANGRPLIDGSKVNDQDARKITEALSRLHEIRKDMGNTPTPAVVLPTGSTGVESASCFQQPPLSDGTLKNAIADVGDGVRQALWGLWNYVKSSALSAAQWFVEKIGGAWNFIVKLAEGAWAFVLRTAEDIARVIGTVVSWLKKAYNSVCDFVRLVFNWDQLKATATSIRTVVNACLTFAENCIEKQSASIELKIDEIEKVIGSVFETDLPPSITSVRQHQVSTDMPKQSTTAVASNLGSYHYEQGMADAKTGEGSSDFNHSDLSTLWNDLTPCVEAIGREANKIKDSLIQTLIQEKSLSVNDIVAGGKSLVGSILVALCRMGKVIVRSLSMVGRGLVTGLKSVILTPFTEFKIIGPLMKKWGWEVCLLDIVAYVLAFPINAASALVQGAPPARITTFDYETAVDSGLKDSQSIAAFNDIKDYLGISIGAIKTLQAMPDIFVEAKPQVFGWGKLLTEIVTVAFQFPLDNSAPGYDKRIALFACSAGQAIVRQLLLGLGLGSDPASSRVVAAAEIGIGILGFIVTASMHHDELETPKQGDAGKANRTIYLNLSGSTCKWVAEFAEKAGVIAPEPLSKAFCAAIVAVSNKGHTIVETMVKVSNK